ncbi:MAG TPA: hypothetical protein VMP03_02845 [Methylomirabilota bacterium]|nr:hypothetical protein [Methylomirabilota bacterium]
METLEWGKLITLSRSEVAGAASNFEYAAGKASGTTGSPEASGGRT